MKNHIKLIASVIACTGLFFTVARAQDMKDIKGMKMAKPAKSMKHQLKRQSSYLTTAMPALQLRLQLVFYIKITWM